MKKNTIVMYDIQDNMKVVLSYEQLFDMIYKESSQIHTKKEVTEIMKDERCLVSFVYDYFNNRFSDKYFDIDENYEKIETMKQQYDIVSK